MIRQTTGDNKNPFRYFSKQELKELFSLEDTHSSTTQMQLQELHPKQQSADPDLMEHIAYLYTKNMFGVSHHDLLFCVQPTEDDVEDHEEQYIEKRVLDAENLMKVESQIQRDLKEFELQNTEPRSLQQSISRGRQDSAGKQRYEDRDESPTFHSVKDEVSEEEYAEEGPVMVLDEPTSPHMSVANEVVLELDSSRTEKMESPQRTSTMSDANDVICLDDDDEANVSTEQISLKDDVVIKQEKSFSERKIDSFTNGTEEDHMSPEKKSLAINLSFEGNSSLTDGDGITSVNGQVELSPGFTGKHLVVEDEENVSIPVNKRVSIAHGSEQEGDISTVNDEADLSTTEYMEEDQMGSEEEEEDHEKRKKKAFVINSSEDEGDEDEENEVSSKMGNVSLLGNSRLSDINSEPHGSANVEDQVVSEEEDDDDDDDVVITKKKRGFVIISSDEEEDHNDGDGDEEEQDKSKGDNINSSQGNSRLDETSNGSDVSKHAEDKLVGEEEADISSGENKSAFLTYSSEEEEEEEDEQSVDKQSSRTASYTSSTPGNTRLTDSNGIASGDDNGNMSASLMEDHLISDVEDSVIISKKRAFVSYSSEEEEGGEDVDVDEEDRSNFHFSSSLMSVSGVGDRSTSSVASRRSLVDNLMEKFEDILMDEDESSEVIPDSDQENDMFNTLDQSG